MNKARIFANIFGQIGQECDHIMFGFALNLIDSVNVKGAFFPNYGGCRCGDNPQFCLCVTGMCFDFKPNLELAFLRPDGAHFRSGISRDHNSNTFCVKWRLVVPLRCAKSQRITSHCGYFARGHLHADSPIGCYRFDACCAKPCRAEKGWRSGGQGA